jgi:hypothetical protein
MSVSELIERIEAHCKATGESETAFGIRAINDGALLADLRRGRSVTLKTLGKIDAAMAAQSIPQAVNQ